LARWVRSFFIKNAPRFAGCSQEHAVRDLTNQLEALKVNDWATALNVQQKIVQNLRKQLARSERGWKAECAAFAGACFGAGEYVPGENAVDER